MAGSPRNARFCVEHGAGFGGRSGGWEGNNAVGPKTAAQLPVASVPTSPHRLRDTPIFAITLIPAYGEGA
jgi:hypothetical protein